MSSTVLKTFISILSTNFSGAASLVLASLVFFIGLIGDMLNRHRIYLEELLYRERERTTRGERGA